MADWKTYAKAARNTARRQAPGAKRALQDSTERARRRAGDYAQASRRAIDETWGGSSRAEDADRPRDARDAREEHDARDRREQAEQPARSLRDEARIYATVAGRTAQRAGARAQEAGVGRRIMRAVRDALLIGGSLLVIWGVLYAAGIPIPFTAVLIGVGLIVVVSLLSSLAAQFRRDRTTPPSSGDRR